jgi:DNA polymerase III epsilon subunit-like protein
MCEAWPGPRCSHDMGKKVAIRLSNFEKIKETSDPTSSEYKLALARLKYAEDEYASTPKGIAALKQLVINNPTDKNIEDFNRASLVRQLQSTALHEITNGRFNAVAKLGSVNETFLDEEEVNSVLEASREYYESFALRKPNEPQEPVSQEVYDKYLSNLETKLKEKFPLGVPPETQSELNRLKGLTPPDDATMRAYEYFPRALDRSKATLDREIRSASALQSVNKEVAQAYYEAYREQYKKEFAGLSDSERPDPPEPWVRGELSQSGYTKNPDTAFAPRDPASLYAAYRLRSDDEATPDFLKNSRTIASTDLETAGPIGRSGFDPENGHIIEIGIVSYNSKGKELSRYEQLIKPDQAFLDEHGTGAEDVHHISQEDLKNSPSWNRVRATVAKNLEGKVLLAQNSPFEYRWLKHHLPNFNNDRLLPVIDTLDISKHHLDLPNHQLETICGAVGVPYTSGHRATHDAEVTGQAYFELRKYIKKTWNSKPARKNAAKLKTIPFGSRWDSWARPSK